MFIQLSPTVTKLWHI